MSSGVTGVFPCALLGRGGPLGPDQVRVGSRSAVPFLGTERQQPTRQASLHHPLLGRVATSHRQRGVPRRGRGTRSLARRGVWLTLRGQPGSGLRGGEEEVWVPLGLIHGSEFLTVFPAKGSGPDGVLQLLCCLIFFSLLFSCS